MHTIIRWFVLLLIVVALAAGGWYGYQAYFKPPEHNFRTATVKKGDLVSFIGATGTIEPEEVVDIGAQVAGVITNFGVDKNGKMIDYGSVVEAGTVLAKIDDTLYVASLEQSEAALALDQAGVTKSEADLLQAQGRLEQSKADEETAKAKLDQSTSDLANLEAKLNQAKSDLNQLKAKEVQTTADWTRAQKLGPSEALSQESYDSYKSAFDIAKANVISGVAAIAQADAAVVSGRASIAQARSAVLSAQATTKQIAASIASFKAVIDQAKANVMKDQAAVKYAKKNVEYCTIASPVKGVIIDRRVNVGQTVVSSLSAPSLFLLAKDLTKMQVWISVNEADIGNIQPQQNVTFLIDAFPNHVFKGKVVKVRLNATMTQNVVTYTVEVETDNSDGKLLPYLTANAHFEVDTRKDVLTVPNAAIRWIPLSSLVAPDVVMEDDKPHRGGGGGGGGGSESRHGDGGVDKSTAGDHSGGDHSSGNHSGGKGSGKPRMTRGKIWVQDGNFVRPIPIRVGITDGTSTEIQGDQIQEGMTIVTGENTKAADSAAMDNPFAPKNPFGTRRGPSTGTSPSGSSR
jgi:HlyD family secretion protein